MTNNNGNAATLYKPFFKKSPLDEGPVRILG